MKRLIELSCIPEYPAVPAASGRKVHFIARIETRRGEGTPARKPLNVALVLDRSGSMSGEKLRCTKKAALGLVDRLTTDDCLSLVSYADDVEVHLAPSGMDDKDYVRSEIRGIVAGGSTNLSGGWLKALSLLRRHAGAEFLSRVLLLTDGEANEGVTGGAELAAIARQHREKGIHTTTIGFGVKFNEELLMSLADDGGGRFHFVKQPEDAPGIFLREFGELSRVFGQNLEVHIESPEGVSTPEILGDLPVESGGNSATVALGDILEAERKEVLFSLALPESLIPGTVRVAEVRVRYDAVRGRTGEQELSIPVTIEVLAPADREADLPEQDPEVARKLALYEIARRKQEASRRLKEGDRAGATRSLRSASEVTQTSLHLDPEAFRRETQTLTLIMDSLQLRRNLEEARKTLASEAHDFHRGRGSYAEGPEEGPRKFDLKPGDPARVREVLECVRAALRAAGHDEDLLARAEYVSGELIANALEHGCRGPSPDEAASAREGGWPDARPPRRASVEVEFEADRKRFRCTVSDTGPGFDFKEVLEAPVKPGAGARGLRSVRQASDGLRFSQNGNVVTVTLKKKRFRVKTKRSAVTTGGGKVEIGIATVEGGVDSRSYGMLEERLDQMVKGRGVHSVIVDLSGCGYLSSTGIGVLVKTQRALRPKGGGKGGRVVIVGMRPFIRRLFDAANLSGLFEFADTIEAAKGLLLLADPGERDA